MHPCNGVLLLWITVLLSGAVSGSQLEQVCQHYDIIQYQAPDLDLTGLHDNKLIIFDNFKSFDYYRYKGRQNFTEKGSLSASNSLIYYSDNTYVQLAELSEDSEIHKIVPWRNESFILSGSGTLGGRQLSHQLIYNLSSFEITEIFQEPLSNVNDILVDDDVIYFAGSFMFNLGSKEGHSVVLWNSTSGSASLLPFGGFGEGSSVNNMLKLDNDNILFVGKFSTFDEKDLIPREHGNQETGNATEVRDNNVDIRNIETNIPVSLRTAVFSTDDGQINHSQMICPVSNTNRSNVLGGWFVSHRGNGEFQLQVTHQITPSKIRIYTSKESNNQIHLFRILTSPARSIMNLTYIDPSTGQLATCDAWCPLERSSTLQQNARNTSPSNMAKMVHNDTVLVKWTAEYQEFAFINHVPLEQLTFIALDSYGQNIELLGIELYQKEFNTYFNGDLNQPNCGQSNSTADVTFSGNTEWEQGAANRSFLVTRFDSGHPRVEIKPSIAAPGTYSINLVTPGCLDDNSCNSRGIINVTLRSGNISMNRWIYQNNYYLKYDPLYSGFLNSSVDITLEWVNPIDPNADHFVMVADGVTIITESIDTKILGLDDDTTLLNGLFQYNIPSFQNSNNIQRTLSSQLNIYPIGAMPRSSSLVGGLYDNTLYIGSSSLDGISVIKQAGSNWDKIGIENRTAGGSVNGIYPFSRGLAFTGQFSLSTGTSSAMVLIDGDFSSIFDLETQTRSFANVTIDDSELLMFDNQYLYNITSSESLMYSDSFKMSILAAGANSNRDLVLVGSIVDQGRGLLNGAISVTPNGLSSSGLPTVRNGIIYRGLYLNESMTAYAYRSTDLQNTGIALIDGDNTPIFLEIDGGIVVDMIHIKDANILAVVVRNPVDRISELYLFNLGESQMLHSKETFLLGESINSIVVFGSSSSLLVGGQYIRGVCRDLCVFNYANNTWSQFMHGEISGDVQQLQFKNDTRLLIVGLLSTNTTKDLQFLEVDLSRNEIVSLLQQSSAQTFKRLMALGYGNETDIEYVAHNGEQIFHYADSEWKAITPELSGSSQINGLTILSSARSNSRKRARSGNELIVINGNFSTTEYGDLNALYYDFQNWTPYYFTTPLDTTDELALSEAQQIFQNRDLSYLSSSSIILNNGLGQLPPPLHSMPTDSHKKPLAKGLVVLIALGLALATVALLGLIGVIMAYMLGDHNAYEPLKPRINENEMLKTVPPEKLMKYI